MIKPNVLLNCVGKPLAPHLIINNVVSNIICSLVFGHRFEYKDEKFGKLIKCFDKALLIQGSIWAQVYYLKYPVRRMWGAHVVQVTIILILSH